MPLMENETGRSRDGDWSDLRQFDNDDSVVTVSVTELASLRHAEASLRDSEAWLRLLQQVGEIGSSDRALSQEMAQISDEFARTYDLPAGQRRISHAAWLGLLHPDDCERVASETRILTERESRVSTQFRIRRRDGSVRWIAMRGEAFPGHGGALRLISAHHDITDVVAAREALAARHDELERLVAERTAALAAAEAQFRAAFDSQFQFVSLLAPDGTMLLANRTALEAGGLSSADVIGRPFWLTGWWPQAERERLRREIGEAAGGSLVRREVAVTGAGGRRIWIDFSLKPVEAPATGRVEWIIAEGRDLTEHRLAEELEQARDEAERATRAKSRFVSGLSHELRTPLNGILGHAQLLHIEGGLTDAQSARVDAMLDAGTHLLQVISRVLDLSKIEAGRVELQPAEVDLHGFASACLDLVRPAAKRLALHLAVEPDTPRRITADPTLLRQVLLNLLSNAVKFTMQGSVELRLRTVAGGAALRYQVSDTGPGIPAELRHRLFRAFDRLDSDATGQVEGAGLGLALSARLAMQMGGHIGHGDNAGGGSIFWLELPLATATAAPPTSSAKAPFRDGPEPQPATAPPSAMRVLVVDDVAMNREITASFIRAAGHEAACAEGGAQAVAVVAATDFDIVLMDLRMPVMDGLAATRCIRALAGARGQVPILALTAQAFSEQIEECRKAGMDGHLAKPFTQASLLAALERAVAAGLLRSQDRLARPESSQAAPASPPASLGLGSELPVLDEAALQRTAAFLKPQAIEAHLLTIARKAEALLSCLRAPNALAAAGDALVEAAHSLVGSSGMLGFDRLAFVARAFERAVRTGAADVAAVIEDLSAALEATIQEISNRGPAAPNA